GADGNRRANFEPRRLPLAHVEATLVPRPGRGYRGPGFCAAARAAGRALGPTSVGHHLLGTRPALGEFALAKPARTPPRSRERPGPFEPGPQRSHLPDKRAAKLPHRFL